MEPHDLAHDEEDLLYTNAETKEHVNDTGKRPRQEQQTENDSTTSNALEPIINAGGLHTHLLERQTKYMSVTHSLLRGDFLESLKGKIPMQQPPQLGKIPPHELMKNKVAKITQRGRIILFMTIFTRRKKVGGTRLIGHPPLLNKLFRPPALHLITLSSLISHITVVAEHALSMKNNSAGELFFIEIDFLNFFPQIRIGEALQAHMGIATRDPTTKKIVYLMQTVLTQGWNASTYIAQSISWSIVEHCEPTEENLGVPHCNSDESPPPFRIATHPLGVALIVIIYDNILITCSTAQLALLWEARINRNTRKFNAIRKYTNATTDACSFCGLDIKLEGKKIHWRTSPNTFSKWQTQTINKRTPREGASLLGIILRQCYVRETNTADRRAPILLLRNLLSTVQDWDADGHITPTTAEEILHMRDRMSNEWCTLKTHNRSPLIIVADATPTKICFIIFDENMNIIHRESATVEHQNIAVTEAIAILLAIQTLKHSTTPTEVIVITDNTTAGRSLAKGYSLQQEVDEKISQILHESTTKNLHIQTVVDITSEENIADVGTRHQDWESKDAHERMEATLARIEHCIPLYKRGSKWISRHDKQTTNKKR